MVTDGLRNSLRFLFSRDNQNDICPAQERLEFFELFGKQILSNKYDSNKFVCWTEERNSMALFQAVILQGVQEKRTDI